MDDAPESDTNGGSSDTSLAHDRNPTSRSMSFEKLQTAVDKSVKRMTSMSRVLPYFKEHFKPVYQADSKNVLEIYKSMMTQLKTMIKEEIQLQLDANNVQELLGSLDEIKKDAKSWNSLQRSWRPSGNPEEDIKAHLQESSTQELKQLEKVVGVLMSHNKLLNESVATNDAQIQESLKMIQDHLSTWQEAATALPDETRETIVNLGMSLVHEPYLAQL